MKKILILPFFISSILSASTLDLTPVTTGTTISSSAENSNQTLIENVVNNLDNTNISSSAAITHSKLANTTAAYILMGNASGVITGTAMSGDATISSSGVVAIATGVIVNADISSGAAINFSKLESLTRGYILRGNSSGVCAAYDANDSGKILVGDGTDLNSVSVSGAITINTAGVTSYSGTVGETKGGTNQTTYTTGDILYASASNTLSKLAAGTSGKVLTMGASVPAWSTNAASPVYDSGWFTLAADTTDTRAHSIGATPSRFEVFIKGESSGTVIGGEPAIIPYQGLDGTGQGSTVAVDGTNFYTRWTSSAAFGLDSSSSLLIINTNVQFRIFAWQ